jgi:hypothetical protein
MNIIEQIKKAWKGENPETSVWVDRASHGDDQTEIGTIGELQALAESHERLLEAAKDSLKESGWMDRETKDALAEAIEQAEKP